LEKFWGPHACLILQLLSYLSTCINPIVYCFMNKRFRESFIYLFLCCRKKALKTERQKVNLFQACSLPLCSWATSSCCFRAYGTKDIEKSFSGWSQPRICTFHAKVFPCLSNKVSAFFSAMNARERKSRMVPGINGRKTAAQQKTRDWRKCWARKLRATWTKISNAYVVDVERKFVAQTDRCVRGWDLNSSGKLNFHN